MKKSKRCPWNGFFSCLLGIPGLVFTTWGSEVRTQRFKHRKIGYQCQLCWVGRKQFLYSPSSKGLYENELEEVSTFIISCNQIWASYLLLFSKTTLAVTVHTHNFGMHKPINFITKYGSWGWRRSVRQKVLKCKVCVYLKGCHLLHTSAFKKKNNPYCYHTDCINICCLTQDGVV